MAERDDFIHLFSQTYESYRGIHPGSDGKGNNWQVWYTRWMLDVSDLPELLGYKPQPQQLQSLLVRLDSDYTKKNVKEDWQEYVGSCLFDELSDRK